MRNYTHTNGDPIVLDVVRPFVQHLREIGGFDRRLFCFQTYVDQASREHGLKHLFDIAEQLPNNERFAARDLLERHLHLAPDLVAA